MEATCESGNVKAIIICTNNPGGLPVMSNTASNEARHLKVEYKDIPACLVAEGICASDCCYIAAVVDKIYTDPSSIVGSTGVIGGNFDFTDLVDKASVKRCLKTAGNNKDMGNPLTLETSTQTQIWESTLDDIC